MLNKYCNYSVYQEKVMLNFIIVIATFCIDHDTHSADIQNVRIV